MRKAQIRAFFFVILSTQSGSFIRFEQRHTPLLLFG